MYAHYFIILTLSFSFSENKGIGANLLKKNMKRRRTKAEIEEEKQEETLKRQRMAADMAELVTLRARIQQAEEVAHNNQMAATVMGRIMEAGHIKQDT